jgi:hypothetical protein
MVKEGIVRLSKNFQNKMSKFWAAFPLRSNQAHQYQKLNSNNHSFDDDLIGNLI